MNKDKVVTQYIICECGDNFPNEKLLNIHLANGHGDEEAFQCSSCPAVFTSHAQLLQHTNDHEKQKTKAKPASKIPEVKKFVETPKYTTSINELEEAINKRKPPVIKVRSLKTIDAISLIQTFGGFGGLLKIQPPLNMVETPIQEVVPPELETQSMEIEVSGIDNQAQVKSELEDTNEEIYYQCDVCNTIFYTEADFDVHYQSTHAMKVEVTAEEILENHLVTDHSDDVNVKNEVETGEAAYYYECEMCHKIFASEEYFNIHYNKVHEGLLTLAQVDQDVVLTNEQQEQVPEAPEQETEDYSIEEHESPPPPKAPEQIVYFKCDLCKILYPSEKAYNTHFNKKHGGQCQNVEPTGYRFIEQDLGGEYPPPLPAPSTQDVFCCEFCPKTFNMKRSLQVHRKRVHADRFPDGGSGPRQGVKLANRSKVCDICGRAYNSNAALRYHQRRHTGEKPYPCTMCPKRFTMPMFLQIHTRTHTGEKPYECPTCPKAFTNKAALIRHDRVHSGVKPYPCPECGKYFTQSNSMKLHVSTVHLKMPAPYKSKNRRNKSEARALQLALKSLPAGIVEEDDIIDD